MGYNTTVVVLNDALSYIRDDAEFGKKLHDAVVSVSRGKPVDVTAGNHCNAATVIETHHADMASICVIGGNCGHQLSEVWACADWREHDVQVRLLECLADKLGYRISKKPVRKTK